MILYNQHRCKIKITTIPVLYFSLTAKESCFKKCEDTYLEIYTIYT